MEATIEGPSTSMTTFAYRLEDKTGKAVLQGEYPDVYKRQIVDGKVAYTAADGSTKYYSSSVANDLGAGNIKAVDMKDVYKRQIAYSILTSKGFVM